jgi:hypothetical protein
MKTPGRCLSYLVAKHVSCNVLNTMHRSGAGRIFAHADFQDLRAEVEFERSQFAVRRSPCRPPNGERQTAIGERYGTEENH